jgi:cytochrome c-type biogenesis protein CcmH
MIRVVSLLLGLWIGVAQAQIVSVEPEYQGRYNELLHELRCLVCQNQTIADSDADLAKDLRAKVFTMVEAGQSQSEVIDYMTTRYGDFVLYRPAFKMKTILLWLGPIVFLLLAIFLVIRWVRKQSTITTPAGLSEAQRASVRDLLNKTD